MSTYGSDVLFAHGLVAYAIVLAVYGEGIRVAATILPKPHPDVPDRVNLRVCILSAVVDIVCAPSMVTRINVGDVDRSDLVAIDSILEPSNLDAMRAAFCLDALSNQELRTQIVTSLPSMARFDVQDRLHGRLATYASATGRKRTAAYANMQSRADPRYGLAVPPRHRKKRKVAPSPPEENAVAVHVAPGNRYFVPPDAFPMEAAPSTVYGKGWVARVVHVHEGGPSHTSIVAFQCRGENAWATMERDAFLAACTYIVDDDDDDDDGWFAATIAYDRSSASEEESVSDETDETDETDATDATDATPLFHSVGIRMRGVRTHTAHRAALADLHAAMSAMDASVQAAITRLVQHGTAMD